MSVGGTVQGDAGRQGDQGVSGVAGLPGQPGRDGRHGSRGDTGPQVRRVSTGHCLVFELQLNLFTSYFAMVEYVCMYVFIITSVMTVVCR